MRFLLMIVITFSFAAKTYADEYDSRNRQACIDELKNEVDKVCNSGMDAAKLISTLKNAGYIAQMDSRVKRVCSYHCPSDIAQKCHALLGKGPNLLQDVLSGKRDPMEAFNTGCTNLNGQITAARKEWGLSNTASTSGKGADQRDSGLAKGDFRKPASGTPAAAPKGGKCNPYNSVGQLELGKCD